MNFKAYKPKKESIIKKVAILILIAVAMIIVLGVGGGTYPY